MDPDPTSVSLLRDALLSTKTGVVAHYYMDVELQGVLQATLNSLPDNRIGIADSLKMGDMAVDMCRDLDVNHIACLGVDFMSESVQTILHKNGFTNIPVYRATKAAIGCSLAESAERESYRAWLHKESADCNALHVIYINTSLETKAISSSIVPTITCTSSNVLSTLLQASAQMKDKNLKILYGPDTYMGKNLETMLETILASPAWTDERIATDLHPQHTRFTLQQLRDSIVVFPFGNCVVHHMFGNAVVDAVKRNYSDAFVTAHLEVPGEMFEIAMSKSLTDHGVVGSTSDILKFISRKVHDAASNDGAGRLKFILGTEAGMVTSIVQSVQSILETTGNQGVEAEIIFPVASEAVTATNDTENMPLVPGVSGGEGCSTAGGCATCPFMKMNDLEALLDVLSMIESGNLDGLRGHLPPNRLTGKQINGRSAVDLGTEAIVYMREFMLNQQLSDDLVHKVVRVRR